MRNTTEQRVQSCAVVIVWPSVKPGTC